MLSHEERRRLDAIAQDLEREDPHLARNLSALSGPPRRLLAGLVPSALLVLGVLGLLTGFLLGDGTVFLVTGLVPAGAAVWLIRRERRGRPSR